MSRRSDTAVAQRIRRWAVGALHGPHTGQRKTSIDSIRNDHSPGCQLELLPRSRGFSSKYVSIRRRHHRSRRHSKDGYAARVFSHRSSLVANFGQSVSAGKASTFVKATAPRRCRPAENFQMLSFAAHASSAQSHVRAKRGPVAPAASCAERSWPGTSGKRHSSPAGGTSITVSIELPLR